MLRKLSFIFLCPIFLLLGATDEPYPASVTVVLDFDSPHSPSSIHEMQRETESLLKNSGLRISWQFKRDLAEHQQFQDLVVLRMKGQCEMDPTPVVPDERGPYASTYVSDGAVLPFGEVQCNRIKNSIKRTFFGDDYRNGNVLLGRALGRVVAHEMYHMMARNSVHTKSGVTQESLSGRDLVSDTQVVPDKASGSIRSKTRH